MSMLSSSLLHERPQTHINLGIALALTNQIDWAIRAFTIAAEMKLPNQPFPHRCLAQIYRRTKRDREKSARAYFAGLGAATELRGTACICRGEREMRHDFITIVSGLLPCSGTSLMMRCSL